MHGYAARPTVEQFCAATGYQDLSIMEATAQRNFGWAGAPYFALNDPFSNHRHDIWKTIGSGTEQTLGLSPHLLDHDSFETTDRSSHAEQIPLFKIRRDSVREDSVPVEQLVEEVLWPQQQLDGSQQEHHQPLLRQNTLQPISKDVRPSMEAPYRCAEVSSSTPQPIVNSGLAKRKRGRPRLHPSPTDLHNSDVSSDIIPDSRRSQLERNRVAAEKCRRRRKEYTTVLSADVSVLSSRNEALRAEETALREELLALKNEILSHAECGSSVIDGYITKSAGRQLITKVASKRTTPRRDSGQKSRSAHSDNTARDVVAEQESKALSSQNESSPPPTTDAHDLFEILHEFVLTEEH